MPKKVTKGRPQKLIGRRLGGRQILGFDGNLAECIHQCRGNVVGVAQGGLQILMRKCLTHHIRIGAHRHLQGGIGMSGTMEGDVLVDTCRFYPIPQGLAGHAFLEAFKHFARSRFAHQFDGFLTKRKGGWCIGLLSAEHQTQADTAHFPYMLLSQVVHVAETESGQTRKERGTFQYFNFTRGLS